MTRGPGALSLRIVADRFTGERPLPVGGELIIGRSRTVDLQIEDESLSRKHCKLEMGERCFLTDLGSANGTRVGGEPIAPGTRVEIAPGEPIELGTVLVVLQRARSAGPVRRVWTHAYFVARLEEACARAEHERTPLAVVRLHVDGLTPPLQEQVLDAALRPSDLVACYAPGEYEILVFDERAADARTLAVSIVSRFADAGAGARAGIGCAPADGRGADQLLGRANREAMGVSDRDATGVIVVDEAMQRLNRLVDRVAVANISVLLLGETGVGKEVMAERVHQRSPRADQPFLRLHCAALSEDLLESELFGHERGAFTGADNVKPGLLESADGGSVFLDEVGELPMTVQVKLLRVLENREVTRVGALEPRTIDVRFISATNRDLEAEVARGAFRRDLLFRLNAMSIEIPPLRDRTLEIPALAHNFVSEVAAALGRPAPHLHDDTLQHLRAYSWPGNIRELRNVIERGVVLCNGDTLLPEHLPLDKMASTAQAQLPAPEPASPSAPVAVAEEELSGEHQVERQRVLDALAACAGNQTQAAKLLGISRTSLVMRLETYRIARPRKKPIAPR